MLGKKALLDSVHLVVDTEDDKPRIERIRELLSSQTTQFETLMGELHFLQPYLYEDSARLLIELAWRSEAYHNSGRLTEAVVDKAWKILCEHLFAPRKDHNGRESAEATESCLYWIIWEPQLRQELLDFFCESRNLFQRNNTRQNEIVKDFLERFLRLFWKTLPSRWENDEERKKKRLENQAWLTSHRPQAIHILCYSGRADTLLTYDLWPQLTKDDMRSLAQEFAVQREISPEVGKEKYLEQDLYSALLEGGSSLKRQSALVYVQLCALQRAKKWEERRKHNQERLKKAKETIERLSPQLS